MLTNVQELENLFGLTGGPNNVIDSVSNTKITPLKLYFFMKDVKLLNNLDLSAVTENWSDPIVKKCFLIKIDNLNKLIYILEDVVVSETGEHDKKHYKIKYTNHKRISMKLFKTEEQMLKYCKHKVDIIKNKILDCYNQIKQMNADYDRNLIKKQKQHKLKVKFNTMNKDFV